MNLPNDPVILLSYINTQLRDHFSSLEDLCKSLDTNMASIVEKLHMIEYHYDSNSNQFI